MLSTCNRVCLIVETSPEAVAQGFDEAALRRCIADHGANVLAESAQLVCENDAVWRLFRVAAGMESMVFGEREVAGQMKRALSEARREQTVSYTIGHVVEEALKTSRHVATETALAAEGRTVVAVGLDLVAQRMGLDGARVLVMGTGSYAGASCAQLSSRGSPRFKSIQPPDVPPDLLDATGSVRLSTSTPCWHKLILSSPAVGRGFLRCRLRLLGARSMLEGAEISWCSI